MSVKKRFSNHRLASIHSMKELKAVQNQLEIEIIRSEHRLSDRITFKRSRDMVMNAFSGNVGIVGTAVKGFNLIMGLLGRRKKHCGLFGKR